MCTSTSQLIQSQSGETHYPVGRATNSSHHRAIGDDRNDGESGGIVSLNRVLDPPSSRDKIHSLTLFSIRTTTGPDLSQAESFNRVTGP